MDGRGRGQLQAQLNLHTLDINKMSERTMLDEAEKVICVKESNAIVQLEYIQGCGGAWQFDMDIGRLRLLLDNWTVDGSSSTWPTLLSYLVTYPSFLEFSINYL